MSTAARKARKASGEKFVREPKTPTPATERLANQPRNIMGDNGKVARFGLTKKAQRDLEARGIQTGGDAA